MRMHVINELVLHGCSATVLYNSTPTSISHPYSVTNSSCSYIHVLPSRQAQTSLTYKVSEWRWSAYRRCKVMLVSLTTRSGTHQHYLRMSRTRRRLCRRYCRSLRPCIELLFLHFLLRCIDWQTGFWYCCVLKCGLLMRARAITCRLRM